SPRPPGRPSAPTTTAGARRRRAAGRKGPVQAGPGTPGRGGRPLPHAPGGRPVPARPAHRPGAAGGRWPARGPSVPARPAPTPPPRSADRPTGQLTREVVAVVQPLGESDNVHQTLRTPWTLTDPLRGYLYCAIRESNQARELRRRLPQALHRAAAG